MKESERNEFVTVRHGMQPPELRHELEGLVGRWNIVAPRVDLALPGKTPMKATLNLEDKINLGMRVLLEGQRACGECHVAQDGSNLTSETLKIAVPNVPTEWYRHARFDHGKHTAKDITCRECHPQAYPSNNNPNGVLDAYAMPRKGAEAVMLPAIGECRKCHSPKPDPDMVKRYVTGKYDCAECHGYHHGKPKK
jgi:hypothetical protein